MDDQERRKELAQFLRTRREQLSPEEIGLPSGTRRRTPGLRREELAQIAGIGVTWYTRLEQGRDITVSAQVLESLARVLRLNEDERKHLYILAREHLPADPYPLSSMISPTLQCILDKMGDYPAYVANSRWDIIAWNTALSRVYNDFGALSARERNILWYQFTNPISRSLLVDWEKESRATLALFRASTERYVGESWYTSLVADLKRVSPEFREWWELHDVQGIHTGKKELNHPLVGRLALQSMTLYVGEAPDLRIIVYTPLPEADTANKLARLAGPTKIAAATIA